MQTNEYSPFLYMNIPDEANKEMKSHVLKRINLAKLS